jgi:hypothetical protein
MLSGLGFLGGGYFLKTLINGDLQAVSRGGNRHLQVAKTPKIPPDELWE